MNKPAIKVGVIGAGGIGNIHILTYKKISGVKLTSFSEISQQKGSTVEKKHNIKWYDDYIKMIEAEDLDAVSICTPPYLQFDIAKDCIKRNISVLIEKPACTNSKDVIKLYELSKKNKEIVMPGYSLFFDEGIQTLFSLMERKELGNIIFAYFNMATPMPSIKWYYQKANSGGGVIVDKGCHLFPIITRLFGVPQKVEAEMMQIRGMEVEHKADICLRYDGFKVYLMLNWLQSKVASRVEIHGTGGSFLMDNYGMTDFLSEVVYGYTIRPPGVSFRLINNFGRAVRNKFFGSKALIYINELTLFVNLVRMKRFGGSDKGIESWAVPTLNDTIKTWETIERIYEAGRIR